jgi:poly(A) polymerase
MKNSARGFVSGPECWHNPRMLPVAMTIKVQDWMATHETAAVMAALGGAGGEPKALFVGGCVRNTLLAKPAGDLDIATVWRPDQVTARLEKAGIKAVPTGIDHGTITAVTGGKTFEITTLRRDVATDGRRAVVAFTQDWREDAQRRDFTMNTLLADSAGHVYDPTGQGLTDLKAGRVVFVGDAAQRIAEDFLRILRFFRFHACYGRGEMDAGALAACRDAAGKISTLSRERITQEMVRMLALPDPAIILGRMFKSNVLSDLPDRTYEPAALTRLCGLQMRHQRVSLIARLAALAGFDAAHLAQMEKYLVFSNAQKKEFEDCLKIFPLLDMISEKSIKELIYKYNNENTIQAVLMISAQKDQDNNKTIGRLKDWRAPIFPVTGNDVKKLGLDAGPEVGRLLKKVESWWLEHEFRPDRAACLEKLKENVQR